MHHCTWSIATTHDTSRSSVKVFCSRPESDSFFDLDALLPLFSYAEIVPLINKLWVTNGVSERLLSAECRVFKSKIEKFYDEGKQNPKIDSLNTVTSETSATALKTCGENISDALLIACNGAKGTYCMQWC